MTGTRNLVALVLTVLPICFALQPPAPEDALLSEDSYTSLFFGFSLPLPADPALATAQVVTVPRTWRGLFGMGAEKGRTAFVISAQQMMTEQAEQLMRATPHTRINGQEFSRGLSRQKEHGETVWKAMYLTVLPNYLLEFEIQSRDPSMAQELERCVEQIRFFDPAKAKKIAGPNARPYSPSHLQN